MRHETLEKLYAEVDARRDEPIEYDYWLADDTTNQLMAEAKKVEFKEGTVILTFDETEVIFLLGKTLYNADEEKHYYVTVLSIGNIYAKSRKYSHKKGCVTL